MASSAKLEILFTAILCSTVQNIIVCATCWRNNIINKKVTFVELLNKLYFG